MRYGETLYVLNALWYCKRSMTDARRWTIVCLLSLGMIIAYVDRSNLSVALADKSFVKEFALSDQDRGRLSSWFFLSYAFLQIPAGFVVDRYGVKFPYALSFAFWSIVSAATGFVSAIWQLVGLRVLLGIGEAVVTPASLRWIRFNVPEQRRGLAVGLYMAGTKAGPAIGAPLAAYLIYHYQWRAMFAILGIGCLVWLIPWLTLVKNNDRELEAQQAKSSGAAAMPLKVLLSTRLMWGIIIGTFCYNYFVFFCMTWLPAYFAESRGMTLTKSGVFTGFSFGGMATVATLAGWVADKMIQRGADSVRTRKLFTIAGFAVASTELIGAMSDSQTVAMTFAIISLSGLGLATANYWALTQTLMPGAAIGKISGVQNMASNLAGFVAPYFTGWLKETTGSYLAPMYAVGVLLLVGIGAYTWMVEAKYAPKTAG
ncbi:MAG: MFS transporter [Candidatus Solibacter usitatus]|nr:MFS transporter [Candidatus Solibacter usitatus]